MNRMRWIVHIHGNGYLGHLFVDTRQEGRALIKLLSAGGYSGFVVRTGLR